MQARGRSPHRERGRREGDGNTQQAFASHHWSGAPAATQYMNHAVETATVICNTLTAEQTEVYVSLVRIDEITRLFQTNSFIPKDERLRSPSPAPIYDGYGRRKNTRAARYRKKYEEERNCLVERILQFVPDYKAPEWYKPKPTRITDKLYIKTEEYPEINFIGLLLGPRGNTLNKLQQESGAQIGIRGKGSVKEGKNTRNISPELNNLQDQLHCLITADSPEKVEKAKQLCQEVMDKAIFSPVGQNNLKRDQLRELAKLNGTFRDENSRACQICGEFGHSRRSCPVGNRNKLNYTNTLVCARCGNVGHFEKDCTVEITKEDIQMDKEFADFMNELNEDNGDSAKSSKASSAAFPEPAVFSSTSTAPAPAPSSAMPAIPIRPPAMPAYSAVAAAPLSTSQAGPTHSTVISSTKRHVSQDNYSHNDNYKRPRHDNSYQNPYSKAYGNGYHNNQYSNHNKYGGYGYGQQQQQNHSQQSQQSQQPYYHQSHTYNHIPKYSNQPGYGNSPNPFHRPSQSASWPAGENKNNAAPLPPSLDKKVSRPPPPPPPSGATRLSAMNSDRVTQPPTTVPPPPLPSGSTVNNNTKGRIPLPPPPPPPARRT